MDGGDSDPSAVARRAIRGFARRGGFLLWGTDYKQLSPPRPVPVLLSRPAVIRLRGCLTSDSPSAGPFSEVCTEQATVIR